MTERSLDINVVASHGSAGPAAWLAEVADFNSPFSGLFVFGPTFSVARDALASVIWTALALAPETHSVAGVDAQRLTQLNLLTVTRKAFHVGALERGGRV